MRIVTKIASVALLATLAVPALAQNLVANGSFENQGEVDNWYVFDGWTLGGTDGDSPLRPPARIYYNNSGDYPNGAYNEAIPVNNAFTISPDAAGQRAAYFVSDFAGPQTLSQMLHLMPGTYEIGFSAYAPANGYANAGDARFTGEILGVTLANYLVSTGPATTWQTFSGTTTIVFHRPVSIERRRDRSGLCHGGAGARARHLGPAARRSRFHRLRGAPSSVGAGPRPDGRLKRGPIIQIAGANRRRFSWERGERGVRSWRSVGSGLAISHSLLVSRMKVQCLPLQTARKMATRCTLQTRRKRLRRHGMLICKT